MIPQKAILLLSFGYISLLFAIAFHGRKRAEIGQSIISNPYIYALSLAVYCTAWTYYGSVGAASRSGITGFLNIYIGPTLTMILGFPVIRKIIRISKANKITSIADFIASRYGKSSTIAGVVTIIAVLGIIPYISVQIKAISTTYQLLSSSSRPDSLTQLPPLFHDTALYVALLLAAFAVLFGARHLDATERHEGLVAAIAFESLVKLLAFLSVGLFVTYGIYNGFADLFEKSSVIPEIKKLFVMEMNASGFSGWYGGLFLSMLAIVFLPRQFQVIVVENVDEKHLNKAIWLFPLYLLLINIFVIPIAFAGLLNFAGEKVVDADFFALMLLLAEHHNALTLFVFIGGLSAATGMVIVETIALSTMICNDLVMPVLFRLSAFKLSQRNDLSNILLNIRRAAILLVLILGYLYFHFVVKYYTLVSIGLISFAAVAQFAPAIIGGIFWKGATRAGALSGLIAGFFVWTYTLVLPSLVQARFPLESFLTYGPFGIELLKPRQLFGLGANLEGFNQYAHTIFWSMFFNMGLFFGVSLFSKQNEVEKKQATLFVDVFKHSVEAEKSSFWRATASVGELKSILERFLGKDHTLEALETYARENRINLEQELTADAGLVSYTEKLLAGAIGSASAHAMVTSVVQEEPLGVHDIMSILDETQQIIIYSRELESTTKDLAAANERLKELDQLKNEFISTVSHELRTPLTSVRALAEILHSNPDLDADRYQKFTGIIITESERLSRLIDDVLNFQKIKSGKTQWEFTETDMGEIIEDSVVSTGQLVHDNHIDLTLLLPEEKVYASVDRDRLIQVMINLLSNAVKFCDTDQGRIEIGLSREQNLIRVTVKDNGIGISAADQEFIFEEFRQIKDSSKRKPFGTGVGLTISRHIIEAHKGKIWVESEPGRGAKFVFTIPVVQDSNAS
ncbi:ATPase/histidine kinase/DNA gyrase B/HSP90 domain protein [delta proteobacterium NaphS2]|nr:ATPase/histidine kinase/DNA gyrase B/HSP90 domain protein [delta proteobacterium NaphS2]